VFQVSRQGLFSLSVTSYVGVFIMTSLVFKKRSGRAGMQRQLTQAAFSWMTLKNGDRGQNRVLSLFKSLKFKSCFEIFIQQGNKTWINKFSGCEYVLINEWNVHWTGKFIWLILALKSHTASVNLALQTIQLGVFYWTFWQNCS
jgi:hypothetical protein